MARIAVDRTAFQTAQHLCKSSGYLSEVNGSRRAPPHAHRSAASRGIFEEVFR